MARINDSFMKPSKDPVGYIVTTALDQSTALSSILGTAVGIFGTNTWDINSKDTWARGKETKAEIGLALMSTMPKVTFYHYCYYYCYYYHYYYYQRLQMH